MIRFKVGRIDFINTAPVYHGIDTGTIQCPGETVLGPPARLNRMLEAGEIQISAISSVAYATHYPDWLLLPHLSISSRGPVESVLLGFREPLERGAAPIIGLSDKSATAKALARILLEDRFGTTPHYRETDLSKGVPKNLDGLLVIGDDALRLDFRKTYAHLIDLGTFWKEWTGLPFVFGLWAVDRKFAQNHPKETAAVVQALKASKDLGKKAIVHAARLASKRTGVPEKICSAYLAHIEYDLDEDHRAGLVRFFDLLKARGETARSVTPVFWPAAHKRACLGQ